jgi:hypothetical protein
MIDDELVLLAGLVFATFVLMSCTPSNVSLGGRVPLITQAQFEQQIEEGFGRIGTVPAEWAILPPP